MVTDQSPVVVGFDASPDAGRALRWAVDAARARSLGLRVVVGRGDLFTVSRWADDWTRGLAEEWLESARKTVAELGFVDAEYVVRDGLPAAALLEEGKDADLVVLGSRGHGVLAGALQGSVSHQVTRHAPCPVVVVRAAEDYGSRRVVVGVDGSSGSMKALEFALVHASAHGGTVQAVHSDDWWRTASLGAEVAMVPELLTEYEAFSESVRRDVAEAFARHDAVESGLVETREHPARALVDASHAAALVVVGSRGRGAFAGMLLGSVSSEVLHRAACPVAVVR